MGKIEEKRRFPRANFLCKIILRANKKQYLCTTQNISSGGMRVLLEDELHVEDQAEITLFTSRQIECTGRVVWVLKQQDSPLEEGAYFDIGIEFTRIGKKDKEFLEELVDKLLNQNEQNT